VDPAHQFYNADKQLSWTEVGNQIHLPMGDSSSGVVGALEVKAAWMELSVTSTIDKSRYKISEAVLVDPTTGMTRNAEVALLGLHIIHKTLSQPTWTWATFEHVDNAPGISENPTTGHYNLYDVNCKDKVIQVPAKYAVGKKDTTVTIKCTDANVSPLYYIKNGGPSPTQLQVKRVTSLDPTSETVNATMIDAIKKFYPNSVFQYYELVDVIWSSNATQNGDQPAKTPLKLTSMNPINPVANSSMETYAQKSQCIDCHKGASIAGKEDYATDFSFVLSAASSASGNN
jgi:hypothetical protein